MAIKSHECIELKNLQYKSMLTGGNIISDNTKEVIHDLNVLDKFLEDNKLHNKFENWSKMDNLNKQHKLFEYADIYSEKNNLTQTEKENLQQFFKVCIQNKQLSKVKEVIYDKSTKRIKDVPVLLYNKDTEIFSLKNSEKTRLHTLKSLPPPKIRGTLKNKGISIDEPSI